MGTTLRRVRPRPYCQWQSRVYRLRHRVGTTLLSRRPLRQGLHQVLGDVERARQLTHYWTGTPTQLYDMFAPVIPIIRNHVPGAIVSTPPVCGGHTSWMASWMTLENTYGRLSDYYGFHVYLLGLYARGAHGDGSAYAGHKERQRVDHDSVDEYRDRVQPPSRSPALPNTRPKTVAASW